MSSFMSSVSLAFLTFEELLHNNRITYAECMPSVLEAKFNDKETSDISYIQEWSFHKKFTNNFV